MSDDDFVEDDEILDDATETSATINEVSIKPSKAWRSIERYREMKALRNQLDDLLFEGNPEDLNELRW
ncbi:MAG: hypothetical protein V2J55_09520 [Candidatus Competibacteraceae bacterium]|jgi:hypothetical protein|nr:hypothetical protein [Candidatus Competibacteraceae bacterium]